MYCENHISKTQAKQKVGEIILRTMLAKELTGRTAGYLKILNSLTFNIVLIIYTCMYKYCHTFN